MAFQWSVDAVVGVAVGGALFVVVLGVVLVVLVSRTNHRRLLTRAKSTGQRRLSRCASAHLSITDGDVARMPGNRVPLRRSLQVSSRRSPYTPMSSRDTLEARSTPISPWQSGKKYQYDNELVQAWPLPRRLQRSQGRLTVKLRSSPAHPTKEKDQRSSENSPVKKDTSRTVILPGQPEAYSPTETSIKSASPTDSPKLHLTPKPLFHGQQRSISHGVINNSIDNSKRTLVRNVGDSSALTPRSLDTTALQRSTSMYKEPGPSPTRLLPPLPFQIEAKGTPKRVQSPTELSTRRLSGGTYLSDNTSILDGDETPKAHSRAETELTSIHIISPRTIGSTAMSIEDIEADQKFTDSPGWLGGLTPSKKLTFQPPLDHQTPFRASVHEVSPESKRGGLSVDVSLHCSSDPASITKLIRGMSFDTAKLESSRQRCLADEKAKQDISRRGRSNTTFHVHKDKSSPSPVLEIISGNKGWITSNRSIPGLTRVATETVQNQETVASRPQRTPSGSDVKSSPHKRKHSPSVTDIPLVSPIPPQNIIEERTVEDLQGCPSPKTVVNLNLEQDPKFRPPSLQTFNPQLPTEARKYNPLRHSSPVSQQLSLDGSQDEDDSPDTEIYTPTRKPSSRRHHLNRLKSIFSTTSDRDSWPLTNDIEPIQNTLIHNHHHTESSQSKEQATSHAPPAFSITFPHFPSPPRNLPRRHNYSTFRGPKILIHGPHAAPWSSHNISTTTRFPARTSSHRSCVTKARGISPGKANTPSSSRSPRRNVLALENAMTLRRMNSEAQSEAVGKRRSPEHKRYLSIGSWESAIFEDEGDDEVDVREGGNDEDVRDDDGDDDGCGDDDDDDDVDDDVVVEGLRKGVRVVSFLSTIPTTPPSSSREADLADWEGGLYDADGFLKEA